MLKLGCTLSNLANIFLYKSDDAKNLSIHWKRYRVAAENHSRQRTIVFTRKAVVDKTFNRKSTNMCKSFFGIDTNQLNPYSMCQPMPTGLYTRWDLEMETGRFKPRQNKTPSFEKAVISYFQRTRPQWKTESFHTTGRRKKFDCFSVDGPYSHCNTVAEAVRCSFTYAPVSKYVLLPLKKISNAVLKKPDELRRNFIKQKGFSVNDMWECERWKLYKTGTIVKEQIREIFPYRGSLAGYQLLEETKSGELFGYVQCNIEIPDKLKPHFSTFSLYSKTL